MAVHVRLATVLQTVLVLAVLCSMTDAIALNETCTDNTNCTDVDPAVTNSVCRMSGATGTCKCDTGYTEDNGNCTRITCPNIDTITNLLSRSTNATPVDYITTVSYTCKEGYQLTGLQTRTCETSGSLSGSPPTCDRITCPNTDTITNLLSKSTNATPVDYDTTVSYTCKEGYQLTGLQTRTCETSGSLSGSPPTCDRITCPNTDTIANLLSKSTEATPVDHGTTVSYTCKEGYQLTGLQTRTCETSGTLSGSPPTCDRITCPNTDTIANLLSKSTDETPVDYGTTVSYTCIEGYEITGSQTRTCETSGSLSGSAPTCDRITCPNTDSITNLASRSPASTPVDFGTNVSYTCSEGYEITGSQTRTCETSGSLSGSAPTCDKISCNTSDVNNTHKVTTQTTYFYNEQVTYACDTGFEHTAGNLTGNCTAMNTWSGIEPTCTQVTCGVVNVANATEDTDETTFLYNETITYTCDNGFEHIAGNLTRTCMAINTWSGSEPGCTRITCQPLTVANAAITSTSPYYKDNQVTYSCNAGYKHIDGDLSLTCATINKWSGTAPVCSKRDIGETCDDATQCEDTDTVCSTTCQCATTHYTLNKQCYLKKKLGVTCESSVSDSCEDGNAVCSGSCVCKSGYYDDNGSNAEGTCQPKVKLGVTGCTTNYQITNSCEDSNAECAGGQCLCKDDYYDNSGTGSNIGTCTQKVSLGSGGCTTNNGITNSCADPNAACTWEQCRCNGGYYDSSGTSGDVGTCTSKVKLGASGCTTASGVTDSCEDSNTICSGNKCLCNIYHYDSNGSGADGICVAKVQLGKTGCSTDYNITDSCADTNAYCGSDSTCMCKDDFYDNNGNNEFGVCTQKEKLGVDGCTTQHGITDSCSDANALCGSNGRCSCKTGYYDNNGVTKDGTCVQKVKLGATSCTTQNGISDSCQDANAHCSGGTCLCNTNYYDNNGQNVDGTCVIKVTLGNTGCTTLSGVTDSCADGNAECGSGNICVCKTGYYDDNGNTTLGTCQLRIDLGTQCQTSISQTVDQCKAENALCRPSSNTYTCQCINGYHQGGSACIPNKALGEQCDPSIVDECSDPDAGCLSNGTGSSKNICTCKPGNYDDNGFTAGGDCQEMKQLMVSDITFTNIQTTSFRVSWTGPGRSYISHVSRYSVSWTPKDTGSGVSNTGLSTATNITGLPTPGEVYTVTVTTYNDITQVGSPRLITTHKVQASKPSTPGSLILENSELDASDNSITLVWAGSAGAVSGYSVAILDGSTEMKNRTLTGPGRSVVIGFDNMKNGYKYTVRIVAYSKTFGGGHKVASDPYMQVIKTAVKRPTKARGFGCKLTTADSITVEWTSPEYPNGETLNYKIEVYLKTDLNTLVETANLTGDKTQYTTTMTLLAGKEYVLRIFTSNEEFEFSPTEYMKVTCKTMDKMSDPPEGLTISDITSRSMTVAWKIPTKPYGDVLGYVLQLRNESDTCHKEIIIKCTDCSDTMNVSSLQGMCPSEKSTSKTSTDVEIKADQQEVVSGLVPDYTYAISVAAVNRAGKGKIAGENRTTLEEAPAKPENIRITNVSRTSFKVLWQKGPVRPGNTSYVIEVKTDSPAMSYTHTVYGFNEESYRMTDLEEYWNYNITVTAKTSIGSNLSDMVSQRTLPADPGLVNMFTIETGNNGTTYQNIIVKWQIPTPLERNCKITGYTIEYNSTTDDIKSADHEKLLEHEATHWYSENITVKPETYYTVEVYAKCGDNFTGSKIKKLIKAPAGIPENTFEESGQTVVDEKAVTKEQTNIKITLKRAFFENQTKNGIIVDDGIIVYVGDKGPYTGEQSTSMLLAEFRKMPNWKKGREQGYWRATKHDWIAEATSASRRRKRAADGEIEYTLGVEDCSQVPDGSYCNGPLDPNTNYGVGPIREMVPGGYCNGPLDPNTNYGVRAATCTNAGCLVSQEYGPFQTKAIPVTEGPNTAAIAGGAAGGVVAALVVVGVVLFIVIRRRKQKLPKTEKCKPLTPTELHPDIERKRPVTLEDFPQHLAKLHKDSNLLFSAEYEDLKTLSPSHPTTAADEEENRLKNRYINILPFDHTRVKLRQKTDDDSDFINANYLPGYKSQREYIGCQGPIPATLDDFWRMVWEQNVGVIVILTLCKEGNKIKCEQYWPDELNDPKQYGDVVVEVINQSNIKFYDYRIFKLSNANVTRNVKHFHFLSWLDFQANITHDTILDFIAQVRSHVQPPDTAGPMIVHCSAGVGRTGTYICLDYLMQFLEDHDFSAEVDIFDMVLKLRENRPHMVQTEQQYVFIHDCLNEMIERKRRALMERDNIYVNQGFANEQEENLYQNQESLYLNVSVSGAARALQNTEL